jgi:HAD superfamily phosphoserine phosphatase-like hydrolase
VAKPPGYKPRLIVFDVEGVLIPRNRFFFLMGKALGFAQLIRVFFYGFLYETGLIPLKSAMKHLFRGARGITIETLVQIASKVPLVPGARAVFDQLKAQGYKTALITSGLPTLVAKLVADKLGADYAFGFEAEINGNKFTGEIWGDVIERNGKLAVLHRIVRDEQLEFSDCAVVADDRNNASIFLRDMLKIAYNPDFVLRIKADNVVTGNISKILSVINGEPKRRGKPSWNDVFRESIHASGVFIPVIAGAVGVPLVAVSIILVLGIYATSEYLRTEGKKMPLINFITRKAASQNELYQIVLAPVYFAIGILITLVIFPAPASSAAIAIFALGDSTASIFGRYLAKTPLPFNKDKSLEGSAAGFFFAFLAGSIFVSPLVALLGAAIAMFIEYLPLPINDNLLIPVITGLALTFLA